MKRSMVALAVAYAACLWWAATASRIGADARVLTPAYGPSYDGHLHMLQEIRDELRGLRADMLSLRPAGSPADGPALLASRCASCHSPARAEGRGSGFVIADPASLSINDRRRMAGKVSRGEMPPGRGLPAGERKAIVDFLSQQPKPPR